MMKEFRETLRLLMQQRKVTAKELSQATGCSQATISQYLNQDQEPRADALLKLSEFFGCSIEFLLKGVSAERRLVETMLNELDDEFIEIFKGTYRIRVEKHIGKRKDNSQ